MIGLGITTLCLVLQQQFGTLQEGLVSHHTEGPFRATIAPDGSVRLTRESPVLHPNEAFGWKSTLCTTPQTGMLLQTRLVRLADNSVQLYREHGLPPDGQGCAITTLGIVVPSQTPPGHYQLQRFLLLTPRTGSPRTDILPPLSVDVIEAHS